MSVIISEWQTANQCPSTHIHQMTANTDLHSLHSQEKVCEDSASFDLTSVDIAHCIDDVGHILKAKVEEQSASADEGERNLLQCHTLGVLL